MRFKNLDDWLNWQEGLHPTAMDLGLDRVRQVAAAMQWPDLPFPVITVAGTNGKGSSVAYLEAIYRAAGLRTGTYTSPHLQRYNERVRISGEEASDADLVAAFARLDAARGDITITYFEYGTLAAVDLFVRAQIDVAILEVGIGGLLDAVNIFDADCALVTTIALDHEKWLGNTRELIGYQKAGIFRSGKPAVCADPAPPSTLIDYADEIDAKLVCRAREFDAHIKSDTWDYMGSQLQFRALPFPALPGEWQIQNAAGVLAVVEAMYQRLPVEQGAVADGLQHVQLRGRFNELQRAPDVFVDVAHNPQATAALAANLADASCAGNTFAVLAMLADKDIANVLSPLTSAVDHWFVAPTEGYRGLASSALIDALHIAGVDAQHIDASASVATAFEQALAVATSVDRILVFGSFHTVGDVMDVVDARASVIADSKRASFEKPG